MRAIRRWVGAAIAALMVVGCAPTTPPPTVPKVGATPGIARGSATGLPSPPVRDDTTATLDLDVGGLEQRWTTPLLEFASDGESVIFSSGSGEMGDAAPDLWRYTPGADAPELLWRNPNRDRSLVKIGGDLGTWAFAELPTSGERAWDFYVLTGPGGEPIHLDTHPGDADVPSGVPSFSLNAGQLVWTSFDKGPSGAVSQMLYATAPDWEPRLLAQRDADEAELWLPSLRGSLLAYTELTHTATGGEEHGVYLLDLATDAAPTRLDDSGLATMPVLIDAGVVWKETEPGFSMFNWGTLVRSDLAAGETSPVSMAPQDYVDYPSAGSRYVAGWGADAFTFTIHDLESGRSETLARYPAATGENALRAHVSGDLLVWLYARTAVISDDPRNELRYAFLPSPASRGR